MGLLEAVVVVALVVRGVVMVIPSSHYWNPAKKVENMPVEDFKDNITFITPYMVCLSHSQLHIWCADFSSK